MFKFKHLTFKFHFKTLKLKRLNLNFHYNLLNSKLEFNPVTCKFEHDDDERDCHPGDTSQNRGRADHGVQAGSDARVALIALALKISEKQILKL